MRIKWIADIGSNHNQSLKRAFKLIDAAHRCGADGIKFQLFTGEELYADSQKVIEAQKNALPPEWIPNLSAKVRGLGLEFGITPFSVQGAITCEPYIDFYKIASFSGKYDELIETCMETRLPLIISTGILNPQEKSKIAYNILANDLDLTLLWCCPEYPAPIGNCDLTMISRMRDFFDGSGVNIGWSDHSKNEFIIHRAIGCGARTIEFHLDLNDMRGWETQYGHVWTIDEIHYLIMGYKYTETAHSREDVLADRLSKYKDLIANPNTGRRGE